MESLSFPAVIVLVLAFIAEALLEYFIGMPFDKFPRLTPYKWTIMYVAGAVGVTLAFAYRLDVVSIIATSAGHPEWLPSVPGIILTGFVIGRGSNFVHDVFKFIPGALDALKLSALANTITRK